MDRPKPYQRARFLIAVYALTVASVALFTSHIDSAQFTGIVIAIVSIFKVHDIFSDRIHRG